jgi:hypothetical protein
VSKVALISPPMTTVASGRCTSAPEFVESVCVPKTSSECDAALESPKLAG